MKWIKGDVMAMKREHVVSSNIKSIGYDPEEEILEVEFTSGAIYQYKDVPESKYKEFMRASSKGKFLFSDIKGKYDFEKISG